MFFFVLQKKKHKSVIMRLNGIFFSPHFPMLTQNFEIDLAFFSYGQIFLKLQKSIKNVFSMILVKKSQKKNWIFGFFQSTPPNILFGSLWGISEVSKFS